MYYGLVKTEKVWTVYPFVFKRDPFARPYDSEPYFEFNRLVDARYGVQSERTGIWGRIEYAQKYADKLNGL
jgi:hypothetical protein